MATLYPITIEQGADWSLTFRWTQDGEPVDLTGYTASLQVREVISSSLPLLTLTSGAGDIDLNADGHVSIRLSSARSAQLHPSPDAEIVRDGSKMAVVYGFYDLEITSPDGFVERLLEGRVILRPEVNRQGGDGANLTLLIDGQVSGEASFEAGNTVPLRLFVRQGEGGPMMDVSTIQTHFVAPDGTIMLMPEDFFSRASTGIYEASLAPVQSGPWEGTVSVQAPEARSMSVGFTVTPQATDPQAPPQTLAVDSSGRVFLTPWGTTLTA